MDPIWQILLVLLVNTFGAASFDDDGFKSMVLEELQMLKTQQTNLEQKLAETLAENERLKDTYDEKKPVKRLFDVPQTVAFSASVSGHIKNLNADQTIVFGSTLTNMGDCYNKTSGVFNVPASGTYLFFANIMSEANNNIETILVADGDALADIYSAGHSFFGIGSNLVIVHLNVGAKVWVQLHESYSTNMALHCCWSTFSGYLLQRDHEDPRLVGR